MVNNFLRTNVPHIWAAGDITGPFLFTYVAWQQGEAAAINATGDQLKELNYQVLPRATYCDPEIASVGLTEKQARDNGSKVSIGRYDYARLTRAIVTGETTGFIKIVADSESGRILGAHIIGSGASDLIHEAATAMAAKMTVSEVGEVFHAYPTFSEGFRYACQEVH